MKAFVYGKMSQHAVSAVSFLAENYGSGIPLSSAQIAQARDLSKPAVAKILTILSSAGLIKGVPGPHGGYSLARHPKNIALLDVVMQFESMDGELPCPLGPGWCGNGPVCPVHDQLEKLRDTADELLRSSNFGGFVKVVSLGVVCEKLS